MPRLLKVLAMACAVAVTAATVSGQLPETDKEARGEKRGPIISKPPAKRRKREKGVRRMANKFECDGTCKRGKKGKSCDYVAERQSDLDIHQGKHEIKCPEPTCPRHTKPFQETPPMYKHYREEHSVKPDGSSVDAERGRFRRGTKSGRIVIQLFC